MRNFCRKKYFVLLLPLIFFNLAIFGQMATVDSLKKILSSKSDTSRIPVLLDLSKAYLQYSRVKALDAAMEAKILAIQYGNEPWEAQSLKEIGTVQKRNGNYSEAISCYDLASKLFQILGNNKEYVICLNSIAETYLYKGDFNQALTTSFDAYKAAEMADYKSGMLWALINSGLVYRSMHNYNKAIVDYEKAMTLSKDAGDELGEASALNNLANVYSDIGENEKSVEFLLKALAMHQRLGDNYSIAADLNNLGSTYMEMGSNLDTINISKENKLKVREYYDKSLSYLSQSFEIRKKIGDNKGMVSCLTNIGNIWYNENDPDKAIEYYQQAFVIAEKIGIGETELSILYNISEAYRVKNLYDSAFVYARKYSDLNDSVFHRNLSERISEMQARYGVEKAESETRAQQKEKKLITIASVAGGVLLMVIVFFLLNRAITRKRINVKLNQQKQEIENKNTALQGANILIESKNKDITDSIQYARRIQEAILPEVEFTATFGDTAFVFYQPKDIVSGDFYWMAQTEEHLLFAAVDCTGHGVPGAFVSIVCSNLLSQSVKEHGLNKPEDILNDVNVRLSETLRQRVDESRVRDGMDIALCCINKKTLLLTFAGAYNPAWIFRGDQLTELLPNKFPVGLFEEEELRKFTGQEFQMQKGDRIYVFTDGYSDQFGGELGKKYKRSTFMEFVKSIQSKPMKEQRKLIRTEHLRWKGDIDQIDDILVIGLQV